MSTKNGNGQVALICMLVGIVILIAVISIGGLGSRTPDVRVEAYDIPITPTLTDEQRKAVKAALEVQRKESIANTRLREQAEANAKTFIVVPAATYAATTTHADNNDGNTYVQPESEQLMELRIRRGDHCVLYKVLIGKHNFLTSTCGGIILLPE